MYADGDTVILGTPVGTGCCALPGSSVSALGMAGLALPYDVTFVFLEGSSNPFSQGHLNPVARIRS